MKTIFIPLMLFSFCGKSQQVQQNLQYYSKGLTYKYYNGSYNRIADIKQDSVIRQDTVRNFLMSVSPRTENFALIFDGFINLPTLGFYTFFTNSDDGSTLFIDEEQIVFNDSLHGARERFGRKALTRGMHSIKVQYFQKLGGRGLSVSYTTPDSIRKQAIPDSILYSKDSTLFYMPTKILVENQLYPNVYFSVDGYEVYKNVTGATYQLLIDQVDIDKKKLPQNYFVWLTRGPKM